MYKGSFQLKVGSKLSLFIFVCLCSDEGKQQEKNFSLLFKKRGNKSESKYCLMPATSKRSSPYFHPG